MAAAPSIVAVIVEGDGDDCVRRAASSIATRVVDARSAAAVVSALAASTEEMVVVVSVRMTAEQCLDVATACGPDRALGFVVARDPNMICSILERFHRADAARGIARAFLDAPFSEGPHPSTIDAVPREHAPDCARERADVLFISGHSNGQCQGGGGIALCQRDARRDDARPAGRRMPCFGTAPCRFPATRYARVPTSALSASVVVSLTCFGVVFEDHALLVADSTGAGLLANPHVKAILTALTPVSIDLHDYLVAAYSMMNGAATGHVASALNRNRRLAIGVEFVCVGDPRQALPRSVRDAVVRVTDDRIVVSRPDGVEGACDLTAKIDDYTGGEVLLVEDEGVRCGALLASGDLFVTLEDGRHEATLIRHDVAALREALRLDAMVPALHLLGAQLAGATAPGDAVERATELKNQCLDVILRHHPSRLRAGSVVRIETLRRAHDALALTLERLQDALVALYGHVVGTGPSFLDAVLPYLTVERSRRTDERCRYCHTTVTEHDLVANGRGFSMVAGLCRLCGRLYEGSGAARWIEVLSRACPGEPLELALDVRNPYAFDVRVVGTAALQAFARAGDGRVVSVPPVSVEPGATARLRVQVPIPESSPTGIHRVRVALLVGAQIEVMFRYVMIEPVHDCRK